MGDCKNVFRRRIANLSSVIREPGPVAERLFQDGIIGKASKERAIQNNVPHFERTSALISAVFDSISADFNKPTKFNQVVNILKDFTETAEIARQMEVDFHGVVISQESPSLSNNPTRRVPYTGDNDETDHGSPVQHTPQQYTNGGNRNRPQQVSSCDQVAASYYNNGSVKFGLGPFNISLSERLIRNAFQWANSNRFITMIGLSFVIVITYCIYCIIIAIRANLRW